MLPPEQSEKDPFNLLCYLQSTLRQPDTDRQCLVAELKALVDILCFYEQSDESFLDGDSIMTGKVFGGVVFCVTRLKQMASKHPDFLAQMHQYVAGELKAFATTPRQRQLAEAAFKRERLLVAKKDVADEFGRDLGVTVYFSPIDQTSQDGTVYAQGEQIPCPGKYPTSWENVLQLLEGISRDTP